MTTMTMNRKNNSGLLLFLLVLIIILFAVTLSAHATDKHGSKAETVRQCLQRNGPLEVWFNKDTGRYANIVCLDNGQYGIQVCNETNEITCFIKEKLKKLEHVHRYLTNSGYSE